MNIPQPAEIERWWVAVKAWFSDAPVQNIVVVIFALLLIFIFRYPNSVIATRNGVVNGFRYLFGARKRIQTRRDISRQLNEQIKTWRTESGVAGFSDLPELQVKWVEADGKSTAFDQGKITVFWRNADVEKSRPENVVKTAMAYVKDSIYPSARPYISEKSSKALDLVLTSSFIGNDKYALNYLAKQVIGQQLRADEELRLMYQKFTEIYGGGLLHNMLLHQLTMLPERAFAIAYSPEIISEAEDFVTFVAALAKRQKGSNIQLSFNREHIKVAICLLGRDETLEHGYTPYLQYLSRQVLAGFRSYYVLAAGRKIENISEYLEVIASNGWFNKRVVTKGCEVQITSPNMEEGAQIGMVCLQILPYIGEETTRNNKPFGD